MPIDFHGGTPGLKGSNEFRGELTAKLTETSAIVGFDIGGKPTGLTKITHSTAYSNVIFRILAHCLILPGSGRLFQLHFKNTRFPAIVKGIAKIYLTT